MKHDNKLAQAIAGCVWGTAVGDALGLPCEGLPPRRVRALFGGVPNGYRYAFRRGMVSDDTEHTFLVWNALAASVGNGEAFTAELSHGLRRWISALPAGVGLATLRAGLRLCFGVPPKNAGVFSAGNGAAMRSAIIGVACAWDDDNGARLNDLVSRSSRLTHTDPKATYGAVAVAVCAACFARHETEAESVLREIAVAIHEPDAGELRELLRAVGESIEAGETTEAFAKICYPRGVSGYVYQTVPVALHAALSHPTNLRTAARSAIACGGDTDTVAAITGAIVGANVGMDGVPADLQAGIWEPTGLLGNIPARAQTFAESWQSGTPGKAGYVPYPVALARNVLFAAIVLCHGFRRLLPPYS